MGDQSMTAEYDLVIIGSGAAGVSAATTAVHLGASRIAVVERGPLWGTCVNTGCIPSKFLLTLAGYAYYRGHGHPGIHTENRLDLEEVLTEKNALQESLKEKKRDNLISRLRCRAYRRGCEFSLPPCTAGRHQETHVKAVYHCNRLITCDPAGRRDRICSVHDEQ